MNEKLKPCPFCGSQLAGQISTNYNENVRMFSKTPLSMVVCIICGSSSGYYTTEEDAIAAWNRRADGWRDAKTDPPDDYEAVNVVWVNRDPPSYYAHEKDVPHVGTAHMDEVRGWYWESPICYDMLTEYGDSITDRVADGIDIICWMPLPKLPEVKL